MTPEDEAEEIVTELNKSDGPYLNAVYAENLIASALRKNKEWIEKLDKVIEKRGYMFQEAQNRTLLENRDLKAAVKVLVGAVQRIDNWIETLNAEQWEKTRHSIEKASENWDRIESSELDMKFIKDALSHPDVRLVTFDRDKAMTTDELKKWNDKRKKKEKT